MKRLLTLAFLLLGTPAFAAGPWYSDSVGGNNANTCLSWAQACATMAGVVTKGLAAGETVYLGDDTAESAAGITVTFPGTPASPNIVWCADHTVAVPGTGDLKTTCSLTATGTNSISVFGSFYWYGTNFNIGTTGTTGQFVVGNTVSASSIFDAAHITFGAATNTGGFLTLGGSAGNVLSRIRLMNSTVKFSNTSQFFFPRSTYLSLDNVTIDAAGTAPTNLFSASGASSNPSTVVVNASDLSMVNTTLVAAPLASSQFYFINDKLHASATLCTTPTAPGPAIFSVQSASAFANTESICRYSGTQTDETTITLATGATPASDGTTVISKKIVTTANSSWYAPFAATPIVVWNTSTGGSVSVTLECVWAGGAVPNNDDIWIAVQAPGTPGAIVTETKANGLAAGTPLPSSTATWNSSPGTRFKLTASITPANVGYLRTTIYAATPGTTFYCNPFATKVP